MCKADMEDMEELSQMRSDLMEHAQNIMNHATEYSSSFDSYSYLWVDDRQEFMRQFLLYGHVLTSDEIESYPDEGVPENPPTLEQFRQQVNDVPGCVSCFCLEWFLRYLLTLFRNFS